MATGGQSSQDVNPELSLASTGQVPIPVQEETEHIPSPLALGNATNTCFVSGRVLHRPAMERDTSDCCEAVRVELKAEFQSFKTEMNTKIDSMKSELSNKSLRIDRLVQDRDRTRGALDNLKVELTQVEREKNLDKREHQMELQEKNEEIKRLRDRNQELETKVKDLTDEKKVLEECIRNHTHEIQTLEARVDNLKNQNAQEINELKATLSTNRHQCNHDPESMAALEERMTHTITQRVALMMSSNLGTGGQCEWCTLSLPLKC
ncbi:rho-associated protein kinase 1-like isoform X2 [Halichondria panicea]|uniref:rho-associated protein kinase 1-like isoform X2 n=1 Tax=Halichondria panicea TaxID=6063 RepID=UPI00312B5BD9